MMSCIIAAYKNNHVCIVRKLTVSRGARTKINSGFLPLALSLYHADIPVSTGVSALFSVCFTWEAQDLYDTRINYSCSKASTEGCMEVALRDHYIMPITSSQWVKMFWHNLGTNNHYNQLAKHFYKSFIKSYQGSTLSSTVIFFGGLSIYLIKYVPHKVRNIGE